MDSLSSYFYSGYSFKFYNKVFSINDWIILLLYGSSSWVIASFSFIFYYISVFDFFYRIFIFGFYFLFLKSLVFYPFYDISAAFYFYTSLIILLNLLVLIFPFIYFCPNKFLWLYFFNFDCLFVIY